LHRGRDLTIAVYLIDGAGLAFVVKAARPIFAVENAGDRIDYMKCMILSIPVHNLTRGSAAMYLLVILKYIKEPSTQVPVLC